MNAAYNTLFAKESAREVNHDAIVSNATDERASVKIRTGFGKGLYWRDDLRAFESYNTGSE